MNSGTRPAVDDFVSSHLAGKFPDSVVLIQHLKRDTVQFVRTLRNHGIAVPLFVAIPYSVEKAASDEIAELGIEVLKPDLEEVGSVAMAALRALAGTHDSVVVQEVGGYLAPILETCVDCAPLACIVEETKNGFWRYQKVQDRLPIPVIQVADTEMKRIEAHFVGEAVCDALSSHLFNLQQTLRYKRVGLIGYGDIGSGVAEAMLRRRISPLVYDCDPIKQSGALTGGCSIGGLRDVLGECDVIVGSTGETCFAVDDIPARPGIRYFASASSRDIEFPLDHMEAVLGKRVEEDNYRFGSPQGPRGELVVLSRGLPINFSVRSLPPNISDLLFLLLSAAMLNYRLDPPGRGLCRLGRKFETFAAETFLKFHLQEVSAAPAGTPSSPCR